MLYIAKKLRTYLNIAAKAKNSCYYLLFVKSEINTLKVHSHQAR